MPAWRNWQTRWTQNPVSARTCRFDPGRRYSLKDKVVNAMELPYSNAKLEATNNLIKVIKRNAFGFRNFENFKKRILIALNIKKERTKFVLSRC